MKNQCLATMVLEKTPESPSDSKETKPVNLKRNQPFTGRTDAGVETPIFWSSDTNSWFIGKVPDPGKDWGQREKRASEDEMAGWHHQCNGHELGQTSRGGKGQRGLACCSPWGHKELDPTGQLKNTTTTATQTRSNELQSLKTVFHRKLKCILLSEKAGHDWATEMKWKNSHLKRLHIVRFQ